MENNKFEEELTQMSKPEVHELKHARLVTEILRNAGDGSVLSAWWLSIPVYILAMLCMQALYLPHSHPLHLLRQLIRGQDWTFLLFFAVVPAVCAIANAILLRKIWFLSGSPGIVGLLRVGWRQILVMLLCALILFIYL